METSLDNILVRYSHPTKFEVAPHGTIWQAMEDGGKQTLFIQLGKDSVVNWVRYGDFLERVFEKEITDKVFIDGCIALYEKNTK